MMSLNTLYESIIPQATRHQLGEYYTPDWLAEAIIAESVQRRSISASWTQAAAAAPFFPRYPVIPSSSRG